MKTSTLILSFILFAFSIASFCAADGSPDPVRDTDGDILRAGTDYRVLPVFRGRGGGLVTVSVRNETCPLDVGQAQLEVDRGLPTRFTPIDSKKDVIRLSTDLNVRFPYIETICRQTTVWTLDNDDGERVVSTGGVEGNPGRETISNWFKIEKDGDDYKFVYCPTVCDTCRPVCGDIGISLKNNIWRLTLRGQVSFSVRFQKAVFDS